MGFCTAMVWIVCSYIKSEWTVFFDRLQVDVDLHSVVFRQIILLRVRNTITFSFKVHKQATL